MKTDFHYSKSSHTTKPVFDVNTRFENSAYAFIILFTLFILTFHLDRSGWANDYYSAAVQAGTKNAEAAFFGSLDASNYIAVDKPPASLWVMEIFAKLFGVNSWTILLPNAIEGVIATLLIGLTVRRWFGPLSGLIASSVFAFTPVVTLMFRYNNPDSLLTLLFVAGAYCITRAIEGGRIRWTLACGTIIGFAFLTKYMEALLVVPSFAAAYLVAAPPKLKIRILHLFAGLGAIVATGGWWVAIAEIWSKRDRPYFSAAPDNSALSNILGADGLNRLTGSSTAEGETIGRGASDFFRLFGHEFGPQASWLLPLALAIAVGLLTKNRHATRMNRIRTAGILWGGWLALMVAVFSTMKGIIHPYYTVAMAPAIAALVGIAMPLVLEAANRRTIRLVISAVVITSCLWARYLLPTNKLMLHSLPDLLVGATLICVINEWSSPFTQRFRYNLRAGLLAFILFASPMHYVIGTAGSTHGGVSPIATPFFGKAPRDDGLRVDTQLVSFMRTNTTSQRWSMAVFGSSYGAPLQLDSGLPVMSIGGFSNSRYYKYSMPLSQFQNLVTKGQVRYYMAPPNKTEAQRTDINQWVITHFHSQVVGGRRIYDMNNPLPETALKTPGTAGNPTAVQK